MKRIIFDIESDNLIETATKIHCLCYYDIDSGISGSLTDYKDRRLLMGYSDVVIGHNCIRFDIPMLEKFLNIKLDHVRQIDTLALSWYLFPNRLTHGLEGFGRDFGIQKPLIETWIDNNDPAFMDKMIHRCSEDVKINTELWKLEIEYMQKIYSDRGDIKRAINYLSFKLKCAREAEEEKIKIDIEKAKENLAMLQAESDKKREILKSIMPRVNIIKVKSKPKVMYKQDGEISELGKKWLAFLSSHNLPEYHLGAVEYISSTEEANPNSYDQLKDWLFKLGWQPITFKYVRKKINGITDYSSEAKKIPQLSSDDNTGLCESVKDLFKIEPRLVELESYFILNNRISYINGTKGNSFLEKADKDGYIKAEINGLTNTLRFQHKKPIANLPQLPKLYWKEIRECLIAPDKDHVLCGSDMSSLESNTRNHFMYFYDKEYVKEMDTPEYDSHLKLSVESGMLSKDEAEFYKWYSSK